MISDTKANTLGRWNDANLIRWQNGRMQPVGGWARSVKNPLASPARNGLVWLDNQYRRNAAYFCDKNLYVQQGDTVTDILPADFNNARTTDRAGYGTDLYNFNIYGQDTGIPVSNTPKNANGFPVRFGLDNWGEQLIFVSSADGRVFYYDPEVIPAKAVQAEGVPGTQVQDAFVTEERHLVILGYSGMRNRVAWSEQEDRTNWNFLNVTGTAGFQDLEGAGQLLTARKVTGGTLIFTSTSVYLMTYIGAPFVYKIVKIADGCPPISPQAITSFGSVAYWLGYNNFWTYDGTTVSPLLSSTGNYVFEKMSKSDAELTAFAGMNYAFPEVWFLYPGPTSVRGENSDYVAYNFVEGWWTIGHLPRTFFVGSAVDKGPIAGDVAGNVFQHEYGFMAEAASRFGSVWAQATVSFDDGGSLCSVTQGQVDTGTADPQSVQFDVGARVVRNGPTYPKGPYKARKDGKIDIRFTSRDFDFKITGIVDGYWSLGAMITDAVPRGKR